MNVSINKSVQAFMQHFKKFSMSTLGTLAGFCLLWDRILLHNPIDSKSDCLQLVELWLFILLFAILFYWINIAISTKIHIKVHLHCQPNWIWSHLGDTPLQVSVRMFPEESN